MRRSASEVPNAARARSASDAHFRRLQSSRRPGSEGAALVLAPCHRLAAGHLRSQADARPCCLQVLDSISIPVDLDDKSSLLEASNTCVPCNLLLRVQQQVLYRLGCKAAAVPCRALSSKVVSQYSSLLSPMAVESVLAVLDPARPNTCASHDP